MGEFGWEIMCWQAFARAIAANFARVHVLCSPGHGHLYQDFADEISEWDPGEGRRDMWLHSEWTVPDTENYSGEGQMPFRVMISYPPSYDCIMRPQMFNYHHPNMEAKCQSWIYSPELNKEILTGDIEPQFIQLGLSPPSQNYSSFDVLFHARNRMLRGQDNWYYGKWKELVNICHQKKMKMGFIGSPSEALAFPQGEDLRGIGLQDLCWVMSHSRLCAGPSSGPMHLASLCKQKHLVWSFDRNRDRYETLWNPLETPVRFIDEHSWHPPVDYVVENIVELLNE